jgi:hypothetical protein
VHYSRRKFEPVIPKFFVVRWALRVLPQFP